MFQGRLREISGIPFKGVSGGFNRILDGRSSVFLEGS